MKKSTLIKNTSRSWLKMLVFPASRPAADISKSLQGIKRSWDAADAVKSQKLEDVKAVSAYLEGKSPQEKFQHIYEVNGWTEPQIQEQIRAARNTRLGSLGMVLVFFPLLVWLVASSALWVSILSGLVAVFVFAAFVAQALRFAWWEAQIEERACFSLRGFLARRDVFKRLVRL
jgi:hypothetical protein